MPRKVHASTTRSTMVMTANKAPKKWSALDGLAKMALLPMVADVGYKLAAGAFVESWYGKWMFETAVWCFCDLVS